jgi:hypothetical protein
LKKYEESVKFTLRKGTFLTLILLGIGIIGGIFFFPINFNNQYTCLYHRIFASGHSYHLSSTDIGGFSKTVGENHENEIEEMMHTKLVTKYVLPFGIIWWISLMVAASAFFWLRHQKQVRETAKRP